MRSRRVLDGASIPTSSMADIAFLLIIFFMVTAVFSATKGLEMRLSSPDEHSDPEPEPAVLVHVTADRVLVDCRPVAVEAILERLQPALARDPAKPVILYTDPAVEYRKMVEVYDALAGTPDGAVPVRNLQVPTRSEIERYAELFGENPLDAACR